MATVGSSPCDLSCEEADQLAAALSGVRLPVEAHEATAVDLADE
jgi:hypothetical protein